VVFAKIHVQEPFGGEDVYGEAAMPQGDAEP
jgi:hypothetical protein